MAQEIANSIVPMADSDICEKAWRLAYRGLDHSGLRSACKNPDLLRETNPAIKQMTDVVTRMQAKRHLADYESRSTFTIQDVADDILDCEAAIIAFIAAPEAERRAFVAFVLFRTR